MVLAMIRWGSQETLLLQGGFDSSLKVHVIPISLQHKEKTVHSNLVSYDMSELLSSTCHDVRTSCFQKNKSCSHDVFLFWDW